MSRGRSIRRRLLDHLQAAVAGARADEAIAVMGDDRPENIEDLGRIIDAQHQLRIVQLLHQKYVRPSLPRLNDDLDQAIAEQEAQYLDLYVVHFLDLEYPIDHELIQLLLFQKSLRLEIFFPFIIDLTHASLVLF